MTLLACPFCGCGSKLKYEQVTPGFWRIACGMCSAKGPTVEGKHELDIEVSLLTDTRAATGPIGAWQMRNGWDHTNPKHPLHPENTKDIGA